VKRLLIFVCISLSVLMLGCASSSPSGQQAIDFKTLTLERARARVGRAVIMGMTSTGGNTSVESSLAGDVAITRIGGQTIAPRYHSIILDAVTHSVGIRLDDGSERFFGMPLKLGKRYLVMTHRYIDETSKPPKNMLDLWVQDVDTDEVVYGKRSETSRMAMQQPARAQLIERHRTHLRALFLDAS